MRGAVYLSLALLLGGCGYVLHESPVQYAGAPKWRSNDDFHVFVDEQPTNKFQLVCTIHAGSDVGDLPDLVACVKIAKKYASRFGGNGAIVETISQEQKIVQAEIAKRYKARTGEDLPNGEQGGSVPGYTEITVIYVDMKEGF